MKKELIVPVLLLLFSIQIVFAIPAAPILHTLKQADGSAFKARLVGDEREHWYETIDGYPVVYNEETGNWEYAIYDGSLKPSGKVVGRDHPFGIEKLEKLKKVKKEKKCDKIKRISKMENLRQKAKVPAFGALKIPVVLINFTDRKSEHSKLDFEELIFGGNGSVREYYLEVSYGKLSLSGNVFGWYTADNLHDYYADKASELVKEAVRKADAEVDFSPFDNDADGYVDVVVVVHSGGGAEETGSESDIWSHEWSLSSAGVGEYRTDDGVVVDRYIVVPETFQGSIVTIGVICHELGHVFGLPDLYDTDESSYGVGSWDLMAYGAWNGLARPGDSPAHLSAWCKWYLGWLDPHQVVGSINATIEDVEEHSVAYQLLENPGGPKDWSEDGGGVGEYFLVENRYKTGFDSALPGEGLLIWHVDESVANNDNESHKFIDLEEADGRNDLDNLVNHGDATDPWYNNSFGFNEKSVPNSSLYNGRMSGVRVYNISPAGKIMTASMEVAKLSPSPVVVVKVDSKEVYEGIFTVNVTVTNVTNLAGFQFDIKYNSSIIDFVSASKGDAISSWPMFFQSKIADNEVKVTASAMLSTPLTGSGVIAKLTFNATSPGETTLDINDGKLSDALGASITASWIDGYVEVLKATGERPVANFTFTPSLPKVGEAVTFNASSSYDPDGYIVNYTWNFGDGSEETTTSPTTTHTYTSPGIYTVTLLVVDNDGLSSAASKNVNVSEAPSLKANVTVGNVSTFVGIFTVNVTVTNVTNLAGFQFDIKYNSSIIDFVSASKGDAISSWPMFFQSKISDNEIRIVASAMLSTPLTGSGVIAKLTFNATSPGETILDINDGKLSDASGSSITASWMDGYVEVLKATGERPVANFTFTPSLPKVGEAVTFNASSSYDPDGYIVNYTWNFGDGSEEATTSPIAHHSYSAPGTYTVTLTVTDNDGLASSTSKQITVLSGTKVTVDSVTTSMGQFNVNVTITNVTNLAGFQFDIKYNSSVIDFVSVSNGDAISDWPMVFASKIADDEVRIVASAMLSTPLTGSGVIAILTFNATSPGETTLDINDGKLSDASGSSITASWMDGYVEVSACIYGDVNQDGSVDVLDLTYLVNVILGDSAPTACSDVNGDESVDVLDLIEVVNIILGS